MKVLLVYPEFPNTYWGFRHALHFENKRSALPPLGLLTISSLLPAAWERRLVDMNLRPLTAADVDWADLVMVSAMLVQKDSLCRVVALCNERGKRVAVGGPYISTSIEPLAGADYIFIGEAETTLPEFVHDFERGAAKPLYRASERPSLDLTPVPDFHLADLDQYTLMPVQYSRGCPYQCEFCDIIEIYGRAPRTKSNQQLLTELEALYNLGWRGAVLIVDDNFIANKRNVKRLLPELIAWSEAHERPFSFITEASVNLAEDDELLDGMRRAGFNRVFLGIETPVEASLKETQKHQNTRRDLLDSVHKIQRYGMEVVAGFIVGFDNDPEDIFERQIRFIRESAIPLAFVNVLTALPDTQLWRRLEREGRLLQQSTGINTDCSLNFIPKIDAVRLVEGYKTILLTIYAPAEYYERALDCLSHVIRSTPGAQRRGGLVHNLVSLARVIFTLGVRDHARGDFWRYLRKVCVAHYRKFDEAILLAACGYHLRKLTEANCG
jgi:radical SAM superfamily enzyme YgiQ (UPF0313 family)